MFLCARVAFLPHPAALTSVLRLGWAAPVNFRETYPQVNQESQTDRRMGWTSGKGRASLCTLLIPAPGKLELETGSG